MYEEIAKTVVFDRDRAIRMREMRRIATDGRDEPVLSSLWSGIGEQIARLIRIRPQEPASLTGIGGSAA
jgi:hypothetical protein